MAFPGTYNITYYKGDTLEFRVYPKDSAGSPFPLSQYASPNGTTRFTIAPRRGTLALGETAVDGYAQISNDQAYILCAITPANGEVLSAGTDYVYDLEIARADATYDQVYTLLTGNISVTEQVSASIPLEVLELPGNATGLTLGGLSTNSITIGWTAPTTGGDVEEYKIYVIPYTVDLATIAAALLAGPLPGNTIDESLTSHTITGLSPETAYLVAVQPSNATGDAPAVEGATPLILSNLGSPITTLPEES